MTVTDAMIGEYQKRMDNMMNDLEEEIYELKQENKRYHDALEELGDEAQIVIDSKSILCPYFIQEIISKALEESK